MGSCKLHYFNSFEFFEHTGSGCREWLRGARESRLPDDLAYCSPYHHKNERLPPGRSKRFKAM